MKEESLSKKERSIKLLDCCGMQCPGPIMKVNEALKEMEEGEQLCVTATDMALPGMCRPGAAEPETGW